MPSQHRKYLKNRFIQPAAAALENLLPINLILQNTPVETLIRALDAGMPIYDAGSTLMVSRGQLSIWKDIIASEAAL